MENDGLENSTSAPAVPKDISDIIHLFAIPTIGALGFVMNCMIIAVVIHGSLRKTNAGIIMAVLGGVDNFILLVAVTEFWRTQSSPGYSIWRDADCRISVVFGTWMTIVEVSLLMLLTLERVVAVKYPFKYNIYFSRRFMVKRLVVLTVASLVIASPGAYVNSFSTTDENYFNCDIRPNTTASTAVKALITTVSFGIPVPFFFIAIIVILRAQSRSNAAVGTLHSTTVQENVRKANTLSLILVPGAYAILEVITFAFIIPVLRGAENSVFKFKSVVLLALTVNSSINLCLYSIPKSMFRSDLKTMICAGWRKVFRLIGWCPTTQVAPIINPENNSVHGHNMDETEC